MKSIQLKALSQKGVRALKSYAQDTNAEVQIKVLKEDPYTIDFIFVSEKNPTRFQFISGVSAALHVFFRAKHGVDWEVVE